MIAYITNTNQNILSTVRGDKNSSAGDQSGQRSDYVQSSEYEIKIIAVDRVGNEAVFDTSLSITEEYFSIIPERNSKDVE